MSIGDQQSHSTLVDQRSERLPQNACLQTRASCLSTPAPVRTMNSGKSQGTKPDSAGVHSATKRPTDMQTALWVAAQRAQVQPIEDWLDTTRRFGGAASGAASGAATGALETLRQLPFKTTLRQLLNIAAKNDHWVVVRLLLCSDSLASLPETTQADVCSDALHTAASSASPAVVAGMLEHSMHMLQPEVAKRKLRSALELAVAMNHIQTAELLLVAKADTRLPPSDNNPILFEAIRQVRTRAHSTACVSMISLLIKFKADIHETFIGIDSRRTPLAAAVTLRAPAIVVARLLSAKADPNDSTNTFFEENGEPVLSRAVQRGHTETVNLLLKFKAGVDVRYEGADFCTRLLAESLRRGKLTVAESLRNALAEREAKPADE